MKSEKKRYRHIHLSDLENILTLKMFLKENIPAVKNKDISHSDYRNILKYIKSTMIDRNLDKETFKDYFDAVNELEKKVNSDEKKSIS